MLILGYLLGFLIIIIIYIHMINYYKINNEIDFVELYEPLKTDYEKLCKNKLPFTVLFENKEHFEEGKNALAPQLLYKKESNVLMINNEQKESPILSQNYERTAVFINDDNIQVKLFPPKSKEYLNKLKTSVWETNILDNIKHLKVELRKYSILIIPPFWNYSFKIDKIDDSTEKNKETNSDAKSDTMIKLEHCFYITYSNLLGTYLEKGKTLIDEFLK